MTLETWMESRKLILLTEKRNKLFDTLPKAPDFRAARAELYHTLTRIEHYQRERTPYASPDYGIPIVA